MAYVFEELEVWKLGRALTKELGVIFYHKDFRNYSFQDQIMRACLSITNNIAEGRERGSTKDFIKFLYYAKGSVGEVRSMLYLAKDFGYVSGTTSEEYVKMCTKISVKLHNLIHSLSTD